MHVAESLKAYEKAVELQRRKVRQAAARGGVSVAGVAEVIQTRVPAKLLNNAAVLYMRVGRPHKALELLEEALEVRADLRILTTCMLSYSASHDACGVDAVLLPRGGDLHGWAVGKRTVQTMMTAIFNRSIGIARLIQRQHPSQGRDELEAAQQVTLGFNRARVREAAGQLTAAAAEYKVTRISSRSFSCKACNGGPGPQTQLYALPSAPDGHL